MRNASTFSHNSDLQSFEKSQHDSEDWAGHLNSVNICNPDFVIIWTILTARRSVCVKWKGRHKYSQNFRIVPTYQSQKMGGNIQRFLRLIFNIIFLMVKTKQQKSHCMIAQPLNDCQHQTFHVLCVRCPPFKLVSSPTFFSPLPLNIVDHC